MAWRLFLFSLLCLSNMHYWPSVRRSIWLDIWPNSFFCILFDFLKVLYFIPGYLCHETPTLARWVTSCIEARFVQLLRTYERSTCSKSSILFTDTKSGPMKNRTTPRCATCTSPKMFLICPPKFCMSIIFNLSWDAKFLRGRGGGQIRCIMGDVQVKTPAILTKQAWSKKGLFILWTSYRGFDSQRFVLLLFSILRVGRPPRHWFISFSRLPFPASFA